MITWKYGKLLATIPMGFIIWTLAMSGILLLQVISILTSVYTLLLVLSIYNNSSAIDIIIGLIEITIMVLFTIFMWDSKLWALAFLLITSVMTALFIKRLWKEYDIQLVD